MSVNDKLKFKLDWLSITIQNEDDIGLIEDKFSNFKFLDVLGYNVKDFEEIPARNFYNAGLTLGRYLNVYYNRPDLDKASYSSDTRNYIFTGQGCVSLYKKLEGNLDRLYELLAEFNANITRVDIALDDMIGILDFDLISDKLDKGEYRSSKRSHSIVKGKNSSGEVFGHTIYVGKARSKSSNATYYLRMYDKLAQTLEKHEQLPEEVENVWQRYELSFSKGHAANVIDELRKGLPVEELFKRTLRHCIMFLEPKIGKNGQPYQNKSLWETSDWWENFLKVTGEIDFSNHARSVMLGGMLDWLQVSVVPSLKLLENLGEEFGFDIYELLESIPKPQEFSKKQNLILEDAREMDKSQIISYLNNFKKGRKVNGD